LSGQYLCTNDEGWSTSLRAERRDGDYLSDPRANDGAGAMPTPSEFTEVKEVPSQFNSQVETTESCCPSDYCWNGELCIEDESDEPHREPSFVINDKGDGYRCMGGEWDLSHRKEDPLGYGGGFCSEETQCYAGDALLSMGGVNIDRTKSCINDSFYVADYYCDAGTWTSRTQRLAQTIIGAAGSKVKDYSLFCDEYDDVFNSIEGTVKGLSFKDLTALGQCPAINGTAPCMNNFCVLKSDTATIFGTTMNADLENSELNIPGRLGILTGSCSDEGDELVLCTAQNSREDLHWHYKSDEQMLIASTIKLTKNNNVFTNLITTLKRWFTREDRGAPQISLNFENIAYQLNYSYLSSNQQYSKVFFLEDGNNRIAAISGTIQQQETQTSLNYVGVEYVNFEESNDKTICSYIKKFVEKENNQNLAISCTKESTSGRPSYVLVATQKNPYLWTDLTAKLRVKDQ
jgi:hypothetical protein